MPNLFNKPVSSGFRNTYTSQFVPLPLEQFAKTNELNQAKQDAEVALLTNTSDAGHKISGIADADNKYVNDTFAKFDEASADLAKKNLTQRENIELANNLIRGVSRDKDLQTIMANKAKYDEYQKTRAEMEKEGHYQSYNDSFIPSYKEYVKNGGYKSGRGLDTTIHKYSEERPKIEEYFNNMGEDGSEQLGKIGDIYYKTGWDGVSKSKATNRAAQAFGSYIQTPEGQQGIRRYNQLVANNPEIAKQFKGGAQEYVFKDFLDAGLERVHGKSTSGLAAAMNEDAKKKAEEENVFSGLLNTETPSTLTNGRTLEFSDNGEIKGSGQGFIEAFKKHGFSLDTISSWWNDDSLNSDEAQDAKYITTGAKLNGVTPKQYAEIYNKTSHMKVEKPLIGKALRDNNEVLFNGGAGVWSQLNVMNTTTGERNMNFATAMEKVADEKGIKLPDPNKNPAEYGEALKKIGVSITGIANPNEFSTKPVIFTVGNNTFAADMTFGGKQKPYKTKAENQKAEDMANYDRLQKGQQVLEKDSKGNDVIYYKDIQTGQIKHKLVKDLK